MDKKIIAVLGIFAMVMIGCAYAADSDTNKITISNVNFTIPEGFSENVDKEVVNETGTADDKNYAINSKTFEKEDQSLIITVTDYEDNVTDDSVKDLGEEKTINNITGYYGDGGIVKIFSYLQDGKIIVITAVNTDDKVIEEVLS